MGKILLTLLNKNGGRYEGYIEKEVDTEFVPRPGEAIYPEGLMEIQPRDIDTFLVMDVRWVFKGKRMIPEVTAREAHHPNDRPFVMQENGWAFGRIE